MIRSVGVIGCGLMGSGIVQVAAAGGINVVAFDAQKAALDKGIGMVNANIPRTFKKAISTGTLTEAAAKAKHEEIMSRITPSTSLSSLSSCDLVIEAIVENMDAKLSLFKQLSGVVQPQAIMATNTSSLSVTKMGAALKDPSRMVGLHFFNPVPQMALLEIVKTNRTGEDVIAASREFARQCGKTAILCQDTPGFVVNRLLIPYMAEAFGLLDRGVASFRDIDTAMQLGASHPLGPITLSDYVGLDTLVNILEGWNKDPTQPRIPIPRSLAEKVKAGHLGRKTGQGFYKWNGDKKID